MNLGPSVTPAIYCEHEWQICVSSSASDFQNQVEALKALGYTIRDKSLQPSYKGFVCIMDRWTEKKSTTAP